MLGAHRIIPAVRAEPSITKTTTIRHSIALEDVSTEDTGSVVRQEMLSQRESVCGIEQGLEDGSSWIL